MKNVIKIVLIFLMLALVATGSYLALFKVQSTSVPAPNNQAETQIFSSWPIFRGNQQLSGTTTETMPERPALIWRFETKGEIVSTAIVNNNTIYVSSTDKKLYALSIDSGSEFWSFEADDAFDASPLLYNNTLYIGSLAGTFYAINAADGTKKWEYKTEGEFKGSANWCKLASGKTVILVGNYDSFLYCFDAESGKLIWKFETENYINGAPAIFDGKALFGGCDGKLRILDIATGKELKHIDAKSYIPGSPAVDNGFVYLGQHAGEIFCININQASVKWTFGNKKENTSFKTSPAITESKLIIGGGNKTIYCLNTQTGKKEWTFKTRGSIDSSALICGNKQTLISAEDGRLYMLNLSSGELLWEYELGAIANGTPVLSQGKIIVGCDDGNLYVLGNKKP